MLEQLQTSYGRKAANTAQSNCKFISDFLNELQIPFQPVSGCCVGLGFRLSPYNSVDTVVGRRGLFVLRGGDFTLIDDSGSGNDDSFNELLSVPLLRRGHGQLGGKPSRFDQFGLLTTNDDGDEL